MQHRVTFVFDQTDDDPADQIPSAAALRRYLATSINFNMERGKRAMVDVAGTSFYIDPNDIVVTDV